MTDAQKRTLIEAAADARKFARVTGKNGGSGFHVGAALLCEDGEIVTGCNVELFDTRVSICAERCAVVKAVSMGKQSFQAIAVVSDAVTPISPCGVCRQFLIEFGFDMPVIMANCNLDEVVEMTVSELTPMAFIGSNVKKSQ